MGDKYELETSKEVCTILKEIFPYKQIAQQELATKLKKNYTLLSKQIKPLDEQGLVKMIFENRKRVYQPQHNKILSFFGMQNIIEFVYVFIYHSDPKTIEEAKEIFKSIKKDHVYNADITLLKHKLMIFSRMSSSQATDFSEEQKRKIETDFYLVKLLQNKV